MKSAGKDIRDVDCFLFRYIAMTNALDVKLIVWKAWKMQNFIIELE